MANGAFRELAFCSGSAFRGVGGSGGVGVGDGAGVGDLTVTVIVRFLLCFLDENRFWNTEGGGGDGGDDGGSWKVSGASVW